MPDLVPGKAPRLPKKADRQIEALKSLDELVTKYGRESRVIGLSDATSSMLSVWRGTKRHLTEMIRRSSDLGNFELKWVAFRDYSEANNIIEQSQWHSTAAPLIKFIEGIECHGGGDREEAVERALEVAANDESATRVLLIGDAPPHWNGDYIAQARRLAKLERPVFSFVVGDARDTYETFSEISKLTGGACTYLKDIDDLLDVTAIVIAHDLGGTELVQRYKQEYELSPCSTGETLIQLLPRK